MTRRKAVFTQAALLTLFAIPATLSFGMSDFFTAFTSYGGLSKSFFDVVYDVFYETILPLVGFTVCLFTAYRWKMSGLTSELVIGDDDYEGSLLQRYLNFALGTIIPMVLFSVSSAPSFRFISSGRSYGTRFAQCAHRLFGAANVRFGQ